MNKRIAAIHDLSGFGKCSLTIILPILSACGLEACPLPTAFLSSHTGGLPGFTHRDLTSDLLPAARQWSELKLRFDGIYSGFLGSLEQISKVSEIFDLLSGRDTLIFVDPCMADNGKLYQTYSSDMARSTQLLCHKADFILPNLTEACLLLNEPYRPERYRTREAVSSAAWCSPELVFPRSKPAPPVWPARETSRFLRFLKKSPDIITVPATCSPVSLWPPK